MTIHTEQNAPSALVFYHYFYPDDVVSALHIGELCRGLVDRGWRVTARPSNRSCRNEEITYPTSEEWNGVHIQRVRRPKFRQASGLGRILNILWMLGAWSMDALKPGTAPDVLIVGTDPILSILVAIVWKAIRPRTKIVHWCFDLYPEAAFADGLLSRTSLAGRCLQQAASRAYRSCDLIVDIGSCMRTQLQRYGSKARTATLVPWALEEPEAPLPVSPGERSNVFGETSLGLMYSGSYGRAHTCSDLLTLSRALRDADGTLAFSARGNRVDTLKSEVTSQDSNVRFVPFASPEGLRDRLASADIHVVSLRQEWTGTVVPSKFFGALAIGRPVLFFGSRESSVAELIEKHGVGWVWDAENAADITDRLCRLAKDSRAMAELSAHCHDVYQTYFSKSSILDRWDQELKQSLEEDVPVSRSLTR